MEERRRVPRHQVGEEFANLPANMSVRVLDISTAGVLLQSPRLLNPGVSRQPALYARGRTVSG